MSVRGLRVTGMPSKRRSYAPEGHPRTLTTLRSFFPRVERLFPRPVAMVSVSLSRCSVRPGRGQAARCRCSRKSAFRTSASRSGPIPRASRRNICASIPTDIFRAWTMTGSSFGSRSRSICISPRHTRARRYGPPGRKIMGASINGACGPPMRSNLAS